MRPYLASMIIATGLIVSGCVGMTQLDPRPNALASAQRINEVSPLAAQQAPGMPDRESSAAESVPIDNIWSSRMERQKRTMQQIVQGTGVQVSQTLDNRLKMEIPGDASFDRNRARIKSSFRPVLDSFAMTLADNPSTVVHIIAHAHPDRTDTDGGAFTSGHATQLRDYLVSRGIASARFHVDGSGGEVPFGAGVDQSRPVSSQEIEIYVAEPHSTAQATQPMLR